MLKLEVTVEPGLEIYDGHDILVILYQGNKYEPSELHLVLHLCNYEEFYFQL